MSESNRKTGLLFGADGRIRPLWRAVTFYVLTLWLLPYIGDAVIRLFAGKQLIGISKWILNGYLYALIFTAIFARYEHRRVGSYGLPIKQALSVPMWEGVLVGAAMTGSVVASLYLLGAMQVHGLETTGSALVSSALYWLLVNIYIGVGEQLLWRGYLLQTLWKSIGFWPGATVAAIACTVDHYLNGSVQNIWDALPLMLLLLMMSYSLVRTGTLWFAVGLHTAFDYGELFILGTNGGHGIQGRLLNATFTGPDWLTGGMRGLHASFLMAPAIVLAWLYIRWRYRPQPQGARAWPGALS